MSRDAVTGSQPVRASNPSPASGPVTASGLASQLRLYRKIILGPGSLKVRRLALANYVRTVMLRESRRVLDAVYG